MATGIIENLVLLKNLGCTVADHCCGPQLLASVQHLPSSPETQPFSNEPQEVRGGGRSSTRSHSAASDTEESDLASSSAFQFLESSEQRYYCQG